MRRALMAIIATAGLSIPVVASAAGTRHIHFTTTVVGAGISANQATYKAHDSHFGDGAGVQTVTVKESGGTDSEITYYGNATVRSKGTFTLGTPDANDVASVTGSGHDVRGTGNAKGLKSTYNYTGTYNTKTSVVKITLTGTYTSVC
jgi:hypothetical protein